MKPDAKKIWFPAKRYGWGWGAPRCWQGWVFLAGWLVVLEAGAWLSRPDKHPALFALHLTVMIAVLIIVCLLKGEKPGWHWGGK